MINKIDLIYADECYEIMGIAFEVFKKLGFGHKENIYQKALVKNFKEKNFEFKEQLRYNLKYKGENLGVYILDFLLFDKIILEIKQKNFISEKDIDQVYRYFKATHLKLGIILTFTQKGAHFKRIVNLK